MKAILGPKMFQHRKVVENNVSVHKKLCVKLSALSKGYFWYLKEAKTQNFCPIIEWKILLGTNVFEILAQALHTSKY